METLFGPVPSRRLGQSLGVDVIPFKKCNWNCVYCQLGRTERLTCQRSEYVKVDIVLRELEKFLTNQNETHPDWITFVGSGEPLLNSSIGRMIDEIKNVTDIPIAVITNGSLLSRPEILEEIRNADALLPTLDAGSEHLFRRLNRSHPAIKFDEYIMGLISSRKNFAGKFWLELMLIHELNTSYESLLEIAEIIKQIEPDEVHISLPTRPPAESWVKKADYSELSLAQALIGKVAKVLMPVSGEFVLSKEEDLESSIYKIVSRHPLTHAQLLEILKNTFPDLITNKLEELERSSKIKKVTRFGEIFWRASEGKYPDDE